MKRSQDQDGSEPLTEQDVRLLRRYGKLPAREDLLDHQLERRKYFDSGDFAVSHAYRVSDIGQIRTGTEHPLRMGISHPLSPVPASSNIKGDSGEQKKGVKEGHKAKEASHLHQREVGSNRSLIRDNINVLGIDLCNTVFMTEALERHAASTEDAELVFFFCSAQDEKRNTSVAVLRGLVRQIMAKCPQLVKHALPYFETPERTQQTLSSLETLWIIFRKRITATELRTMFCVLIGNSRSARQDAECIVAENSWTVCRWSPSLSQGVFKLAIVSRHILGLQGCTRVKLDPDHDEKVVSDIELFVCSEIWEALEHLPSGPPAMYNHMLLRIPSERTATSCAILRCLNMLACPLQLQELAAAVGGYAPSPQMCSEQATCDAIAYCGPESETQCSVAPMPTTLIDETPARIGEQRGMQRAWFRPEEKYDNDVKHDRIQKYCKLQFYGAFTYNHKGPCHIYAKETKAEARAAEAALDRENAERRKQATSAQHQARAALRKDDYVRGTRQRGGIDGYRHREEALKKVVPWIQGLHAQGVQIERMEWPGHSPDVNASEHAWPWIRRHITKEMPQSTCEEECRQQWEEQWNNLPQEQINKWIDHVAEVVRQIIKHHGDNDFHDG
ncbi:cAMP-regulated phosphoprotein family protein [Paraphaeosphaeria sporulosa]